MKSNFNFKLTFVLFSFLCINSRAQIKLANTDLVNQSKINNTYLIDDKPQLNSGFIDVMKRYWKFSEVTVVGTNEIKHKDTSSSMVLRSVYHEVNTGQHCVIQRYLNLTYGNKNIVGYALCGAIFCTLNDRWDTVDYDFSDQRAIYDWSPGMLRNYIQQINYYIKSGKSDKPSNKVTNTEELKKLKNDTLFIADYLLLTYEDNHKELGGKPIETKNKIADMMKGYSYKYKCVPADKLSKMLLDTNKQFFYMAAHYSDLNGGALYVANSKIGNIIYSRPAHWKEDLGISEKDVKVIMEVINGK